MVQLENFQQQEVLRTEERVLEKSLTEESYVDFSESDLDAGASAVIGEDLKSTGQVEGAELKESPDPQVHSEQVLPEDVIPKEDSVEEVKEAASPKPSSGADTECPKPTSDADTTSPEPPLDTAPTPPSDASPEPPSDASPKLPASPAPDGSPKSPPPKTPDKKTSPKASKRAANGSPRKTPVKSPTSPRGVRSPVFSPENHKKHVSAFKQREQEKKAALEARRKAQEAEMEARRLAIQRKHEAAEKRLKERAKTSPRKSGTFGTSLRSRSTLTLNIRDKRKSGSTQALEHQRPASATPTMRRPVSMGALPTSCNPGVRRNLTLRSPNRPPLRGAAQPIIKQTTKKDDTKKIRSNVELKSLMKSTKVGGFTAAGPPKKPSPVPPRETCSTGTLPKRPVSRTQSRGKPPTPVSRRNSVGKTPEPPKTPVESAPKPESADSNKLSEQEEAKQRLEDARKKAREDRLKKEEEMKRIQEERRIEEERQAAEAEEARQRLIRERELRKKQAEEAERVRKEEEAREAEARRIEAERKEQEERERQEQESAVKKRIEEDRLAQLAKAEEERRERQKKIDALMKRSSMKVDLSAKREISASTANILAKHNITLNLGSTTTSASRDSAASDSDDSARENNDNTAPVENAADTVSSGAEGESAPGSPEEPVPPPPAAISSPVKEVPGSGNDGNRAELISAEKGEFDVDKVVNDYFGIADQGNTKEADEFTIGATSPEESHLSNVL